MLKLFDEGLKGAIIKILKCAITNKLETKWKTESLRKEVEVIKKNQRKFRIENTIMVAFNNRIKGTKERISEVKDFFKWKLPKSKEQGKKKTDLKIFEHSYLLQKEWRNRAGLKKYLKKSLHTPIKMAQIKKQ